MKFSNAAFAQDYINISFDNVNLYMLINVLNNNHLVYMLYNVISCHMFVPTKGIAPEQILIPKT